MVINGALYRWQKNTNIKEIRVEEVHDHEEVNILLEFIFIMKMAK